MSRIDELTAAKRNPKDEFYTSLKDVSAELKYYKNAFAGKVVLCNCDDPYESNFFKYFALNFNKLKLKKLIATCYKGSPVIGTQLSWLDDFEAGKSFNIVSNKKAYKIEISSVPDMNNDGVIDIFDVEQLLKYGDNVLTELSGDGDFRSDECIEILKSADIICTNPPFSKFREYVSQLFKYEKKFLIIGNINAITYKEFFPYIENNLVWLGVSIHSGDREFRVPDDYPLNASGCRIDEFGNKYIRVKGVRWYTNLDHYKRHEELDLYKKYSPEEYPSLDNYRAIEVKKTAEIPRDYFGVMAVPITFLDKYCSSQFEIVGRADANIANENNPYYIPGFKDKGGAPLVGGEFVYKRILIQRCDNENRTP